MGFLRSRDIAFLSAAVYKGGGASSAIDIRECQEMTIFANVTEIEDTETLDLGLEISPDGEIWSVRKSFTQITAIGTYHIEVPDCIGKYARISYDASDDTTFSVAATAKG